MSRGNREAAPGNFKASMRDNYSEHGVEEYYRKVGATYRNPHFPGVRSCMFLWMNRWWQMGWPSTNSDSFILFDMACGIGEVTLALMEWWKLGRLAHDTSQTADHNTQSENDDPRKSPVPQQRTTKVPLAPPIGPDVRKPTILAADPYTSEAYHARTTLTCSSLSFRDIAEGALSGRPSRTSHEVTSCEEDDGESGIVEMVVCSFALHLLETPSELFALLWELSTKARWLIILAPHKKPDIKDGWGWCKWDVESWSEVRMAESKGEYLQERVHCRVYKSLNIV